MSPRYDEREILELVEETLDPVRADVLREAMAADPSLGGAVSALRRDRAILRTLAAPALPRDFVADLASDLAPVAPTIRLARRRLPLPSLHGWGHGWGRLAAAACLGAAATVALWMVARTSSRDALIGDMGVVTAPPGALAADDVEALPPRPGPIPPEAELHHRAPAPEGLVRFRQLLADSRSSGPRSAPTGALAVSEVVLVIETADPDSAVAALRANVAGASAAPALVRNFNLPEALALDRQWLALRPDAPRDVDLAWTATSGPLPPAARRMLVDRAAEVVLADPSTVTLGAHLAGPRDSAPPAEVQLELSEHGFAYTLAASGEDLTEVLAAIAADPAITRARLLPRDADSTVPAETDLDRWRQWREAVKRLRGSGRIALPIRLIDTRRGN